MASLSSNDVNWIVRIIDREWHHGTSKWRALSESLKGTAIGQSLNEWKNRTVKGCVLAFRPQFGRWTFYVDVIFARFREREFRLIILGLKRDTLKSSKRLISHQKFIFGQKNKPDPQKSQSFFFTQTSPREEFMRVSPLLAGKNFFLAKI